jgi:hypothetical protein
MDKIRTQVPVRMIPDTGPRMQPLQPTPLSALIRSFTSGNLALPSTTPHLFHVRPLCLVLHGRD